MCGPRPPVVLIALLGGKNVALQAHFNDIDSTPYPHPAPMGMAMHDANVALRMERRQACDSDTIDKRIYARVPCVLLRLEDSATTGDEVGASFSAAGFAYRCVRPLSAVPVSSRACSRRETPARKDAGRRVNVDAVPTNDE